MLVLCEAAREARAFVGPTPHVWGWPCMAPIIRKPRLGRQQVLSARSPEDESLRIFRVQDPNVWISDLKPNQDDVLNLRDRFQRVRRAVKEILDMLNLKGQKTGEVTSVDSKDDMRQLSRHARSLEHR
ncbi:hypothetical protein GUITHDRAFT_104772 [Guillardia theta CCMP2712]|uniref:Uncharacterized protein n=1 Tax=Guillardia theta (strain CCMP2712) TaxID=905079 RepID=L1JL64_GUITC|nr:hypothetical protein GUITHDRAFT_104772 [Guillardia theta CCMP2712]EKX49243.1 hypothetical protein GUITHDRAFT_104772 [Guillardia theta CCMP2712]|eukprot:XP_005836223.1 hypothetical protein GUITHDRAFT_104772 [Guillardia theta CCMP2712]